MSSAALIEAKDWADELLSKEFKGRGDKEYLARYRLSKRIGVSESYLYRLQYKTREMKEVAGSVYRALMLAYEDLCLTNEDAAARYRADRKKLRKLHAADQQLARTGMGVGEASD